MSEGHPASDGHVAKSKESLTVNAASVSDRFAGIPNLIGKLLTAMMTHGPDNHKPYGDRRMVAVMLSMVENTVSAKFKSVDFEIRLHQTRRSRIIAPTHGQAR